VDLPKLRPSSEQGIADKARLIGERVTLDLAVEALAHEGVPHHLECSAERKLLGRDGIDESSARIGEAGRRLDLNGLDGGDPDALSEQLKKRGRFTGFAVLAENAQAHFDFIGYGSAEGIEPTESGVDFAAAAGAGRTCIHDAQLAERGGRIER